MSAPEKKNAYKGTLNLPKTGFAMKANLVQREPLFQKRWAGLDMYSRVRQASSGRPRFVLHDGPPYANGSIHMGHLLNKVLKDLVVRSRGMLGFDAPFVPGWDCHGLPIEHKVLKELGPKAEGMNALQIRRRCQTDAEKFVKLQSKQMIRLGTLADYAHPYLTMTPDYEASSLEVFAALVERGLVFRALRPVHWSIANRTALADAELEYRDREDPSIFVNFELTDPGRLPASLNAPAGEAAHVMIWTTTPWTLPANRAVAAAPGAEYGLYRVERDGTPRNTLVAVDLEEAVLGRLGESHRRLGSCRGSDLESAGLRYRHPFMDREGVVVTADYVTLDDGTGLVHTAPGHGADDFQTGQRIGLEIDCPVREDGTFEDTMPDWLRGIGVWDANPLVIERLKASGHLFHHEVYPHSYPHDWRSKTPTIFRATEQWFVSVDHPDLSVRDLAMQQTESDVRFHPEWGRNRMRGMLESRPDWCISRQRAWGLPIPAFFGPGGDVLLTPASIRAVADRVRRKGAGDWFEASPAQILEEYDAGSDPAAPDWARDAGVTRTLTKGGDIFDVWFESGSSWNAVVRGRDLGFPADLYLEGSDQHRGWFQLSLLLSLGVQSVSPFKAVLTHGFMVDRHGMKMSKSLGNTLDVDELIKDFGADVARWWVCSLNFENDIKVDRELMQLAGEEYRKVRNTIRFLLSNLGDFDSASHRREIRAEDAATIDAWVVAQLDQVIAEVRAGYEEYQFRRVHEAIFRFCNETLSAVYMAASKDRLYCDPVDSDRRRRTQTAMHDVASALIRLVAPILVHTADEAFLVMQGEKPDAPRTDTTVHLEALPEASGRKAHPDWPLAMTLRERALKALEEQREATDIANPLDAAIHVTLPADEIERLRPFEPELADLCGVSRFVLSAGEPDGVRVEDLREAPRCERSWKRDRSVKQRSDGGWLTDRDAAAVGVS